ncbi:MAG: terpene cyclase/mutase family protein [Planctomycetes bacterium]|nr:terpene cyclase/mutase family protein [Planctomycetota bacterium]
MQTSWIVWGVLLVGGAVTLAAIVRTKWLQSQTLPKCVLLSVVLHAVVAVVCGCFGGRSPASWGQRDSGRMTMLVVLAEDDGEEHAVTVAAGPSGGSPELPTDTAAIAVQTPAAGEPVLEDFPAASDTTGDQAAVAVSVPLADEMVAAPEDHVPLLESAPEEEPKEIVAAAADPKDAAPSPALPAMKPSAASRPVPAVYADRAAGRRTAAAAARGGSQETERAVQAALAWLAAAQSSDGRWNAVRHGGGAELSVPGHHRHGVGARSDHGVTGLALLAFLGAGSTHQEGAYSETVARGLRFLVERQRADGSLAGDAEFFAALYCHGMGAIALAECCAMTGDASLRPALEKAVAYTVSMQSQATGGWRYAAGDKGDTSQLGWQVMLLSSARQAGMAGFEPAETRARAFLQSVSSGRAGGLAAYRAGERPGMAMTAEALVCRLFLGLPADHPSVVEALDFMSRSPPDRRAPNAYAWYYATLASFHAGGSQWEAWNLHLQAALLPLQRRESSGMAGSWDPDPVWGGHGGRVYATAMAAMTLEVYYRYLPMHRQGVSTASVPRIKPQ